MILVDVTSQLSTIASTRCIIEYIRDSNGGDEARVEVIGCWTDEQWRGKKGGGDPKKESGAVSPGQGQSIPSFRSAPFLQSIASLIGMALAWRA